MLGPDLDEVVDIRFVADLIVAKYDLKELLYALFSFLETVAVFLLVFYEEVFRR